MKIDSVSINNRRKCLQIDTEKGRLTLPFSKLVLRVSEHNRIKEAYVDEELGREAITYVLDSGEEASIHLDAFLDYHKDPDYMRKMVLYKLTLKALKAIEVSGLSKREIVRRLNTSPAQLYRLLNTSNYSKTIDQIVKLLAALGFETRFIVDEERSDNQTTDPMIADLEPSQKTRAVPNLPPVAEELAYDDFLQLFPHAVRHFDTVAIGRLSKTIISRQHIFSLTG